MTCKTPCRHAFIAVLSFLVCCATVTAQTSTLTDDTLAQLGQRYTHAINEYDADALGALLDLPELGRRTAITFLDNESQVDGFLKGFLEASANGNGFAEQLIAQVANTEGSARYLRVAVHESFRGPLIRLDLGETGYNYMLLIPSDDGTQVIDMYVATTGRLLSETMGGFGQLMVAPSQSLLRRVLGVRDVDERLASQFQDTARLLRAMEYEQAYAAFRKLPADIRQKRAIIDLGIMITTNLDERRYRRELSMLAKYFSDDPSAAFTLVDHYFYTGELDQARKVVEDFQAVYGEDGATEVMLAGVALTEGDNRRAGTHIARAIELEPEEEEPYWTLVTIDAGERDFPAVIDTLTRLEDNFGYAFDRTSFDGIDVYAEFIQSAEFDQWMGGRE